MAGDKNVWDLRELREIVIPEGVERIGSCWFYGSPVESVTIPASVREIGSNAFIKCKNLKHVNLSEGLEKIEYHAFIKNELEEVALPSTLKEIQYYAFSEHKNLKTIWVGDGFGISLGSHSSSLTILPSRQILVGAIPLWDLRALRDVRIPDGVEKVGGYWFSDSNTESVEIAASVRELGPGAFYRCNRLGRVSFQEGSRLEKIGDVCFYWATVEKVVVPRGVEQISAEAFSNYRNLKEVAFEDGSRLSEVGKRAFFNCKGLKNINFPEGLERIERYAFAWCGLEEIMLPSTLREVQK